MAKEFSSLRARKLYLALEDLVSKEHYRTASPVFQKCRSGASREKNG
jgi:hypothetical protein